jgi:hypothetical protein
VWAVISLLLAIACAALALWLGVTFFDSTLIEQAELARNWLSLTSFHWKGAEIQAAMENGAKVTDIGGIFGEMLPTSKVAEAWAAKVTPV